jgi:hypothetical protein
MGTVGEDYAQISGELMMQSRITEIYGTKL